mgnify:CR=1 FL=1
MIIPQEQCVKEVQIYQHSQKTKNGGTLIKSIWGVPSKTKEGYLHETENDYATFSSGGCTLYTGGTNRLQTTSTGVTISHSGTALLNIAGSSSGTSAGKALFKGYRNANDNGVLGELQFINQRDGDVQAKR